MGQDRVLSVFIITKLENLDSMVHLLPILHHLLSLQTCLDVDEVHITQLCVERYVYRRRKNRIRASVRSGAVSAILSAQCRPPICNEKGRGKTGERRSQSVSSV